MDIKKTYSYFLKDYLKTTGIVYLVFAGVTILMVFFALIIGESFALSDVKDLIPNYFIVGLISFIVSIIFSRNSDLICNQFGKSRETAFFSNILVFLSLAVIFAFLFSILKTLFFRYEYSDYMRIREFTVSWMGPAREYSIQYANKLSFFLYNFTYYSYIAFAFSAVGIFVYSLWVRLEKLYRWIVFLFIPIGITFIIPRFVLLGMNNPNRIMNFFNKLTRFFGLENGFSYQYVLVSSLVFILPLLIISYFIMRKKPLYGKKK